MQEKKSKIIILGPGYPYRNGPSVYLSLLCKHISEWFDIELINYKMLYPAFLFPGKTQYETGARDLACFPNKRMINSLGPLSWLKTAGHINKANPDLIVINWWHPFFALCHTGIINLLRKNLRTKIVFITENIISHEAGSLDKMLSKSALKKAKAFIALSESVEKELKKMFKTKVFRSELPLFNIYEKTEEKSFSDSEKFTFLFFGIVRRYKGLDILINAFAKLIKLRPEATLLIAGEFYDNPKTYIELIENSGLQKNICIENRYIENAEVEQYFAKCRAVVLPYRSATQSAVLTLAYSYGKPVIATKTGSLGSFVQEGKTGLLTEADAEDICRGMQDFMDLEAKHIPFAENIKSYVQSENKFLDVHKVFFEIINYLKG